MSSKIEWTDETWNPVVGCSKVSEGCKNCYAEKMANRLKYMLNCPQYLGKTDDKGNWTGEIECCEWLLEKPLHWRKPRRIFVCSMSDLFHARVPFEFIGRVFATMIGADYHIYQILTKRPPIMNHFIRGFRDKTKLTVGAWKHIWPGVTVESPDYLWRITELLKIPAKVRIVSCEPLLEMIDIRLKLGLVTCKKIKGGFHLTHLEEKDKPYPYLKSPIGQVIIGCESGPKRRPCKLEWVRSIVNQCKAASVPVFVKQLNINGKVERDIRKFPKDLQIREYPNG